uniref:RNA cytidine acetyltransferase n=1 Tax=Chaetoceros debilis TaxID=122233 RepID=A0A7S3QD44_9STRA
MVRKKLDERVRTLIERGVVKNERSILVLVGDHGKDQVPNIHHLLTKTSVRARPKVLWCYKKELGFSTHKMKRMKKIKRDKKNGLAKGFTPDSKVDNFELFLSATDINWCYYKDSHRVLGSTVGMLVLQDFEALTPNLMARTIETVEGGGLVIFLMRSVKSLKQLYAMSMDVHSRYRTEGAGDVIPRFNERFILSLGGCNNCLVCDDELNVLPLSKSALKKLGNENDNRIISKGDTGEVLRFQSKEDVELEQLKDTLRDTPHVGVLVDLAKTMDQAKAILTFLEACAEKTSTSTVALTAGRGRGKSAAIGLCLAGALSFGYSTINVTAPEPENLVAVFDFVLRGLKALKYQEHLDFTIKYNNAKGRDVVKCIVAVEVYKSHRQSITYVPPDQTDKFAAAELVAIDEAAAIPLPIVRALMMGNNNRLTFMSSTVNGYEGTGRALSLKLIKEMRDLKGRNAVADANAAAGAVTGPRGTGKAEAKGHEARWAAAAAAAGSSSAAAPLREIELATPIRYNKGDPVESWLNKLLCLDCGSASEMKLVGGAPAPTDCELYHVDRDALFSYHKLSESFLQKMMGLYSSAHYKNTPNDLQMLSDAPAHSVFVLLSPSAEEDSNSLPDILAVVQIALEGKISRKAVEAQLARGHRAAGDLIPWTISQQFGDSNFAQLSGARVVRVAVHPSVQGMGYGSRAVELLYRFYNGEMVSLTAGDDAQADTDASDDDDEKGGSSDSDSDTGKSKKKGIRGENITPRKELPPLLLPLTDIKAPRLDWIGTSFGLTGGLHRFWKRSGMRMLYLRQTKNDLTGEHSAIMVRALPRRTGYDDAWLPAFVADTQRRIISLLGGPFRELDIKMATAVLEDFDAGSKSRNSGDGEKDAFSTNKDAAAAIEKRSGSSSCEITVEELNYYLTPHDLKRLELYGRNLCDHHLVADLLSVLARIYFTGRFGTSFTLSSLQGALLCSIGLQNRTVDHVTTSIGLPPNQVLAMFNKAIRKLSIALNEVVEKNERSKLLGGKERIAAQGQAEKMKDISHQTLEEDAEEGAKLAMATLNATNALPPEVSGDQDIMKYAIKGDDTDWKEALKGRGEDSKGMVQIKNKTKDTSNTYLKRKLTQEDIDKELGLVGDGKTKVKTSTPASGKKRAKKAKKRKN